MSLQLTDEEARALWQALDGLDDDILDPSYPEVFLDEDIRAAGEDPDELARRGADFVRSLRVPR